MQLAVRAMACPSGLRIYTGGLVGFLRTRAGGQEGSEMAGGEQSRRRVDLPRRKPGRNSRACVAEVEDGCLGVDSGSKAELARGFAGVGARQCRVAGVEQSFCAGGTMGRRWLGLRGAVGWVRVRRDRGGV